MYKKLLPLIVAAGLSSGCASIVGKRGAETLNLSSSPERADVTIADESGQVVYRGSTPTVVNLEKKRGYFSGKDYIITIAKSGYRNQTILVKTRPNGWYLAGNLLFGGLIGYLIVDPLTGAMWTFDTNAINANLANDGVSHSGAMGLHVVMLRDVPPELRGDLIQLSSSRGSPDNLGARALHHSARAFFVAHSCETPRDIVTAASAFFWSPIVVSIAERNGGVLWMPPGMKS